MKRKQWFVVAAAALIAVASMLYLQARGTTPEAMSEEIPTEAFPSTPVQFMLIMGQPGSVVTVTADSGKLSQSPDAVTDDSNIGQAKHVPDAATSDDTHRSRMYWVDSEGCVTFSYTGDASRVGRTATITVSRAGDADRVYEVEIVEELTPEGERGAVNSIDHIELHDTRTLDSNGVKTLYLQFRLVDQSGAVVRLHPNSVLYLHYRIDTPGTGAYLFGDHLPQKGGGEGSMAQVQETEHLIMDSSKIEVPVAGITDTPISLHVGVTDEGHNEYAPGSIRIRADMQP